MNRTVAKGWRVLVVEDEFLIALSIEQWLQDIGAVVIGPASSLEAATKLADEVEVDVAVLDVNIRGGTSYPVADILAKRGIPFVLCSGYGEWSIDERHRARPRLSKPYSEFELQTKVMDLLTAT